MNLLNSIETQTSDTAVAQEKALGLQRSLSEADELQGKKKAEQYWKVAEGFDELFIYQMFTAMRKSTLNSGLLGDNNESRIYNSMFDQEVAVALSKQHNAGLSRMIFDWLTRNEPEIRNLGISSTEANFRYRQNSAATVEQQHYQLIDK